MGGDVEHRPLTDPRAELVRSNALATYLGLVGSVSGTVVTRPHGFTLVRGPGLFSFCNFAAGFEVKPEDLPAAIQALRDNAEDCFGFYVFVMTGDCPTDLERRLLESGFEIRQELVGMASTASPEPPELPARAVIDHEERRAVASFMASQFFWRMPREAREAIAAATAAGAHTLWSVGEPADPEAAVMLVEQPESVGLFNLCVRPERRRTGLGSEVVKAVQAAASSLGRPVVLQCEEELVGWYRRLGFEAVGTVKALSLSDDGGSDIISV